MQKPIEIFTDGACSGNPGPGGWGVLIIKDGLHYEYGGGEDHTTNNIMELTAAIEALAELGDEEQPVKVYTDSEYLKKGITQWVHLWKVNNWRKSDKSEVKNAELWQELDDLNQPQIQWEWVKGHADNPYNCRVDKIARSFAEGNPIPLKQGEKPGDEFVSENSDCKVEKKPLVSDEDVDVTPKKREKKQKQVPPETAEAVKVEQPAVSEKEVLSETQIPAAPGEVPIEVPVEAVTEATVFVCIPFIDKIAGFFEKKGYERISEDNQGLKYAFKHPDQDLYVEIFESGAFMFRGPASRVDKLVATIGDADNRYLEKWLHNPPLSFPEDLAQWQKEHFEAFLRPFRKGMVSKWKFKLDANSLLAHDPQHPDIHFEVTTGKEPGWKIAPPASIYPKLRSFAESALTFEDRFLLGVIARSTDAEKGDAGGTGSDKTVAAYALAPLNSVLLNLAQSRNWEIIAGSFETLKSSEKYRIEHQIRKHMNPITAQTLVFSPEKSAPGKQAETADSGTVSDSAIIKKMSQWILETLKLYSGPAFGKFTLDLLIPVLPGESGTLNRHFAGTVLHEKVRAKSPGNTLETAVMALGKFYMQIL